ncbi:ABC transporter transmembrane domain-containing protein [Leptospira sp. GIMC2001]|uniref:ABC transporter transmembrane domain-containing protein n=1 Tax=Leptospira sp. GIMC2001 TaxID=1513297 RepID=UPI002348F331|nr:ABC transporter transmembrane domain-containing protein [Leptospira sp. GIMC2001]WCL49514.1 ABC transporter transmembrane domain-containing protein [Leptospira sp. GIMC2001]
MIHTLKHIWPFLKPYKFGIIWAGISLIFTSVATLSLGQGLRILVDIGFSENGNSELLTLLPINVDQWEQTAKLALAIAFLGILGLLLASGTFVRHYLVSWIGERVSTDLRISVFNHVIDMEPTYFEENSVGEIQSRILTDTTLLQTVVGSSFSIFLRNTLIFFLGVIWLFITNPKLTGLVLISVPLVVFPILLFGKKVKSLSKNTQDRLASVGSHVNESLLNIRTVQAFHHQDLEKVRFTGFAEEAFTVSARRILFRSFMIVIVISLIFAGISFMIWTGGKDVLDGTITPGELIAFSFYAIIVASALGSVSEVIGDLQRAAGATERLIELLNLKPKIQNPVDSQKLSIPVRNSYTVEFNSVNFYYPSRLDKPALDQLSLIIPAGKVTALVGPSGAGKSTIFDLILRFHDPSKGSISINEVPINFVDLKALRNLIGVVPQQPNLFSGTVESNILYGKPDANFDDVVASAKAAHCLEFIEKLPNKFQTALGENGVRLSGGQKQRIAIARAVLKNPAILLLDEATSALDAESEFHIQKALQELTAARTTLMIAHRLSTVIRADLIYVLDQGRVVGKGTHSELLENNELYRKLAQLQLFA